MSQQRIGGSGTNIYVIPDNTVVAGNVCSACSSAQNYNSSVTKCPGGTFVPRYAVYVSNAGATLTRYRSADNTSGLYDNATIESITTDASLWYGSHMSQQTYYDFVGIFSGQNGTGTQYANADGTVTDAFKTFAAQTSSTAPTIYTYHTLKKADCDPGQYLECFENSGCHCQTCPAGSYCSGVTNQAYSFSTVDYGKTACPTGMTSKSGSTTAGDCYTGCEQGTYYSASTQTCTICPADSYCPGGYTVTGNQSTDIGQNLCTDYLANTTTNGVTGATSSDACVCDNGYYMLNGYMNNRTCKACTATTYTTVTTTDCTSQIANATAAVIHRTCYYTGGKSGVIGATSAEEGCTGATGCTNKCVLQSCATDYTPTENNTCAPNNPPKTCSAGYYLKCTTTSCECQPCPAGYYCEGGSYNQVTTDASIGITGTINGGIYNTGCGTTAAGAVCSSAFTRGQISAGYWSSGGGTSPTPTENGDGCVGTDNTCGICPGSAFSAAGASSCISCPSPYTQSPEAGHTAQAQCQAAVNPGYRIPWPASSSSLSTPGITPVTNNFNGWFTTAHYVNYGNISPTTFCMQGYRASATAAIATIHNNENRACVIDVPAGYKKSSYLLSPLATTGIRLRLTGQLMSTNSKVYIYEFSVPDPTNPSVNLLEDVGCTMSITSGGTTITDADKATDGIISYDNFAVPTITDNVIILEWNCPYDIPVTKVDFSIATTNTQTPYFSAIQLYTAEGITLFNSTAQYNPSQFFTTRFWAGVNAAAYGIKPVVQTVIVNPPLKQCNSGYYNDTARSAVPWGTPISCTNCSTLSGINADISGNYSSVSPYDATTTCRFTPYATTAPEGCATITPNTVAYDGTAWGDGYYSVTAQDGYSVLNSPSAAPTCPIETYTITYELNGGTNSDENPTTYTVASDDIVLADPTRLYYEFGGWYTDADFTTPITSIPTATTGNITLYAKWTLNKITIKYDSNGGSVFADMICDYGSQITLADAPIYSGNQFGGWSLNRVIHSAGATITCDQATLGITSGSIMATATWDACPEGKYCPADKTEPQDCPDNYSNSTAGAVSDAHCYLTTEPGKYVATQGAGQITCESGGHYCPGDYKIYYNGGVGNVTGGMETCSELDGVNISTQGITYSTDPATGASQSSQCRLVGAPITITGCSTVIANTVEYNGTKWNDNYYTVKAAPGYRVYIDENNPANPTCVICEQDTYQQENDYEGTECTECLSNYYTYGNTAADHDAASDCQISCPGGTYLANANDTTCTNVGAGNWATNSIVAQGTAGSYTECADGLTTIGYGTGANEADDCGRIFNFGDKQLYLRSAKRNDDTPALHVKIGNTIFYGTMKKLTDGPQSGINAAYDGENYLIVNDEQ